MRIDCESCGAVYAIDDSLISDRGVRAQCPRCSHQKVIKKDMLGADPFSAAPATSASAPGAVPADPFAGAPSPAAAPPPADPFAGSSAAAPADPFGAAPAGAPSAEADPFAAAPPAPADPFAATTAPAPTPQADPFSASAAAAPAADPFLATKPAGDPFSAASPSAAPAVDPFSAASSSAAPAVDPFSVAGSAPASAGPSAGGPDPFASQAAPEPAPEGDPFAQISVNADASDSSTSPEPERASASAPSWNLRTAAGSVEGPLSTNEIKERIRAGTLTAASEIASGDELFVPISDKRVFSAVLRSVNRAESGDRGRARGASIKARSSTPLILVVVFLLLAGGGAYVAFMHPEWIPGMGGGVIENPVARQVSLWRLQFPDLDGTSGEHVIKGRKYYLDDTAIGYRMANESLRKALLLDPENLDAIAAYVENLARIPNLRQRPQEVKLAFEAIDYAIKREPNRADLRRAHGALLLALNNVQKAQSALHMALRINSQDAETLLLLAESDIGRNDDQSLARAKKALEIDPSLLRADLIIGRALVGQGKLKSALQSYKKRLKRDPQHAETLKAVAQLYADIGAFDSAAKTLEKVIKGNDADREARLQLALTYYQGLEDAARADAQLTKAIDSIPTDVDPDEQDLRLFVHLAHVRARRGKWDDAQKYARQALLVDTTFLPAHYALGLTQIHAGNYDDAIRSLDRVVQATQGRFLEAASRSALADARLAAGQFKAAARDFERVVDNFPDAPRAYLGLAAAYARLDDPANMAMAMRKLIDIDPDVDEQHRTYTDYPAYSLQVDAYRKAVKAFEQNSDDASIRLSSIGIMSTFMGQYTLATEYFKKSLDEDPKNLAALIYRGVVALRRGDGRDAIPWLKKAFEVNRLHRVTRYLLGKAYFSAGDFDQAQKTLEDLLNDDSTFMMAHCLLGDIERKENHPDKARNYYLAAFRSSLDLLPSKRGLFLVGD